MTFGAQAALDDQEYESLGPYFNLAVSRAICRRGREKLGCRYQLIDMPDIFIADSLRSVVPLSPPASVALVITLSL